jgi:hypothetical protein
MQVQSKIPVKKQLWGMDRLVVSSFPRYNGRHPVHLSNRDRETKGNPDQFRRDHFPCPCCDVLIPDDLMEGDPFGALGLMKYQAKI